MGGLSTRGPVAAIVQRLAGRLRFPTLFLLAAVLFVADLALPDVVPFVDEVLLGLATVILGTWRDRREAPADRTPVGSDGSDP